MSSKYILPTETASLTQNVINQDCIFVSYNDIVKCFGEPNDKNPNASKPNITGLNSDYVITRQWVIQFSDGIIGTIQDRIFRNKINENNEVTCWYVGSLDIGRKNKTVVYKIKKILGFYDD